MEKKKKAANIYIIILFGILNLVCFDFKVFQTNIRAILLFAVTTVIFFYFFSLNIKRFKWKKLTRTDWIISAIIITALIDLVYHICTGRTDIGQELAVLAMGMSYFILRRLSIDTDIVFKIFNASNLVGYIFLIITYITKGWGIAAVRFLTGSGCIVSWLILGISVSILAYCTSEGKIQKYFYGIGMLLGSFLLFMQKNMTAILIIEGLLLMLPFIMKPSKGFIKKVMEMFFAFNFLLCNMSLITGYVEIFKGLSTYDIEANVYPVTYDLEVSVYLEMALALAGLGFFTLWDKQTNESDAEDKLLPEMLPFFKAVIIIILLFLGALFAASTRGASVILPEVMYKLLSLFILSISGQAGVFYTVGERYGEIGAVIILVFLTVIAVSCLRKSEEDEKEQKLLKCIAVIYVAQSIFLRQTVVTTPLYMVFVISYMNRTIMNETVMDETVIDETAADETAMNETAADETVINETAEIERNITNEADNSDTMLQ